MDPGEADDARLLVVGVSLPVISTAPGIARASAADCR